MVATIEQAGHMTEDLTIGTGDGWNVAGVLCELEGAVLTSSVGDGGLAGRIELVEELAAAANDARFELCEEELG